MTLPGVGAAAAQSLVAALGDWLRFPDGDAAASYLGLTPSVRQSAHSCHYGRITKAGNPQARWLLTQAARTDAGQTRRSTGGRHGREAQKVRPTA